ncbi:hypothetical protein Tco_1143803 [Tanacetum coccineum]
MHNNIMAAGSRDRPPMLATGRYAQWRSHFLWYIDTKTNGDALRKCILEEKEAIHMILTGIGDEIYFTVDACNTAHEMWEAIERLQQEKFCSHMIEQKYWDKKIYKPTNNNLITSSNTKNKNVDTTPRYKNDNQTGQFGNQRAVNVVGARETVGGLVVQQSGIQCFNCKEFAEQSDWLADTDEEIDEQELEAHYSYMAKIQEVPNADSGTDSEPLEQVQYDTDDNVFANDIQHFDQSESISNTCAVETDDSNVTPDSPDMCDNDIQDNQNDVECDDERVALANLIANLKLDVDENKKIQKQLKKANATLTQELTECKSILAETSRTLGESNSIRDSCLVALQNKQTEFERYKAFNDRTVDYDKLEHKLNEALGLLAQKEIDIKEGLKVKAYEISVVKEKHDELVKQSLLTKSYYEGLVKEKTKVIMNLKLKEEKDIDKMISMENQIKFLNEIVYKRSQSIQTIHMLAPKCPTFNGRPTFANPRYLKKAQNKIPCLYAIPHDQSDPANRLVPDREETQTLEEESRSKLNKDLVKPFDYTKLNRKGILEGPYIPSTVVIQAVPATENSLAVLGHTTVETILNMSPANKAHFESEKEAIHMILTRIGDEIYSTVDACNTAHEIWESIKRLQQGESLNIQDVKTNLFWEFGKFTSHDGESIESYYSWFYKLMNEMIRNNLTVGKMQVNVQFLQQLQPEWSRFVTIVKKQHKLDEVSYHKFFDILKQYQKKVNELRAKRIAKNANPLTLVATAQPYQDLYYQTLKSHKSYAPTSRTSLPTRSNATTRHKGNEIAKPITPPSESASEEDSNPKQALKDKEMQKNLALIAKYFKKLYKPTTNNLRTSSNTRNKNVDTTPRYKNDNQSGYHFAKECRKPKRVKDSTYHKEKMLLCKQAEKGVQLQAEQSTGYMAKIQEVHYAHSGTDSEPLEQVQYDTGYNVFANEIQHSKQSESISNTCVVKTVDSNVIPDSPDMLVDQSLVKHSRDHFCTPTAKDMEILIKTCLMPRALETQNDSFVFFHELKKEMHADLKYVESIENEIDELESDKAEFSNMYDMLLKECVSNDVMCSYLHSLSDLDAHTELQCLYPHKFKECECFA